MRRLTGWRRIVRMRDLFALPTRAGGIVQTGAAHIPKVGRHTRSLKTMYAVIATGGKQYRVEKGGVLRIEKLTAELGSTVEFNQVLLIADGENVSLGKPLLAGGKVLATVEKHAKGDKVTIVKFRRRKHYLRQKTHRQQYTQVRVTDISGL
jgi:large subunit ribosomal protein L21